MAAPDGGDDRPYATDSTRWTAVANRSPEANNHFVYCVRSTRIYCRPSCKARLARRANVSFYSSGSEAEAAGFRACKRCRPELASYDPQREAVQKACEVIETWDFAKAKDGPGLEEVSRRVGLTRSHFHRVFKSVVGCSPKEYARRCRDGKGRGEEDGLPVATGELMIDGGGPTPQPDYLGSFAIPEAAGSITSNSSGITNPPPTAHILFTTRATTHGILLVAFNGQGICSLRMGDSEQELLAELLERFPRPWNACSRFEGDDVEVQRGMLMQQVGCIVEALEQPSGKTLEVVFDPDVMV